MHRFWLIFTFAAATLLGLLAIVAPFWILDLRRYSAPLFPLIRSGVEGMSLLTLVFLFCAGFLVGCFGVGSSAFTRHRHSRAAPDIGDRRDERFVHNTQSLAARILNLWPHQSVCGCRSF